MSEALKEYRRWEEQFILLRIKTNGEYSDEEGPIIERMTATWKRLSKEERELLDKEGPAAANCRADQEEV